MDVIGIIFIACYIFHSYFAFYFPFVYHLWPDLWSGKRLVWCVCLILECDRKSTFTKRSRQWMWWKQIFETKRRQSRQKNFFNRWTCNKNEHRTDKAYDKEIEMLMKTWTRVREHRNQIFTHTQTKICVHNTQCTQ